VEHFHIFMAESTSHFPCLAFPARGVPIMLQVILISKIHTREPGEFQVRRAPIREKRNPSRDERQIGMMLPS
jgi:hypothetical protein